MNTEVSAPIILSPAQRHALEFLNSWRDNTPILHVSCDEGHGRTTVLREFHRTSGGYWLDVRPFVAEVAGGHPAGMEDAAWEVLTSAVEQHPKVIIDDFHLFFSFAVHCHGYPRNTYYESAMKALLLAAQEHRTQLVLGTDGQLPEAFSSIAWSTSIGDFSVSDYQHLLPQILGQPLNQIDFDSVYRFAPNLSCHRMAHICHWLGSEKPGDVSTESLLDFIQSQGLASNIRVDEVQHVELQDLCGIDEVITSLEDNIIMPLENLQLAAELGLTPKRGVMLAGPPGTGKTTIGRALARRLRGKFFLIDGTIISGTDYFYHRVDSIFRNAIRNAPSVVFIDDSDVIFESGKEHGLYRYLLTMLDGLESKSASNVCVIMTAMDLGNIPPALVRSGRIELWLEMKLPDATDRRRLIERLFDAKVSVDVEDDWPAITSITDGFSGADLKRLVQDAKLRMAVDMTRDRDVQEFSKYMLLAAESISHSRQSYADAAARAVKVNADRPRWFNIAPEIFET